MQKPLSLSCFGSLYALYASAAAQAHYPDAASGADVAVSASSLTRTIIPPTAAPSDAHQVPKGFVAFGFAGNALPDYAGSASSPNIFSQNLLKGVTSRTGANTVIRVGGTTADAVRVSPGQSSAISSTGFTVGPPYFQSYKNFITSANNRIIPQVPLGSTKNQNLTNALNFIERAVKAIGLDNVESLEIGNEPSAYNDHQYTISEYVQDFKRYERALAQDQTLGLRDTERKIFQSCDTASNIASMGKFTPQEIFNDPNMIDSNLRINVAAEHYYQAKPLGNLQELLMNHTAVADMFQTYTPSIDFLARNFPAVEYTLSEVGNSLAGKGNPGNLSFQAGLGAALWSVDMQLYAMSKGVKRVHMMSLTDAGFSLWQPIATPQNQPAVRGPYYAQPFIADFISTASSTLLAVHNIDLHTPYLSAYAAYSDKTLTKVSLVNLQLWDGTKPRPAKNVRLQVPGKKGASAKVSRLTSRVSATAQADQMSYAGLRWSFENHGKAMTVNENAVQTVQVGQDGILQLTVADSEAAMIVF